MANSKKRSRRSLGIIAIIVLLMCALIIYKTGNLKDELKLRTEENERIVERINEAEEETGDIREELKYRQTDDYIEDQAREKFGFVYPDEVIIKPDTEEGS